ERTCLIYRLSGQYIGQVHMLSPVPIQDSVLLGVNEYGWIYEGVNLSSGPSPCILVVKPDGQQVARLSVHRPAVGTAVYGQVSPQGAVYLVQSSSADYRIVKWTLSPQVYWHWV
ncbi:MAG: hypothetical protein OWS74_06540, partial [Firmicutes bacterium]|nr:hypothetical protein [Bacillota bacterium]